MMTEKHERQKCKHTDVCFAPCSMKEPRPKWYIVAWPCYEPEPPAPLDLGAIRASATIPGGMYETSGASVDVLDLCGEVERLRQGLDDASADLRLALIGRGQANAECDELRARYENLRENYFDMMNSKRVYREERDELRDELAIAREARDIVQKWNGELGQQNDELSRELIAACGELRSMRTRLAQAEQMHCAGDDDASAEDLIPGVQVQLHQAEIDHLRADGMTVLFRRIEPQPEPYFLHGHDGWRWFLKYCGGYWGTTPEKAIPLAACPLGGSGDIVTADGLTLRIASVDVVEPKSMLGNDSAGWFWRVGVEVVAE